MDVFNLVAKLSVDSSGFDSGIKNAKRNITSLSKTFGGNVGKMGRGMEQIGNGMTAVGKKIMPMSAAVAGGFGIAIKKTMDFDSAMSEVGAISGATGQQLDILRQKAKDMGASTKFSATESAEAMKYMAMAGWDTTQMTDGLAGIMDLAAASGENLGTTSDIVTDALTAFGMQAKDSSKFADLLASASSNSNTNVSMLGESFKYVAPLFGALGYSAEDSAMALGLMANAGIKGSQAGTTLRGAITRMTKPSEQAAKVMTELGISLTDANGEMLPFKDSMDMLREKFSGLTAEQKAQKAATLFGQEAMSGMLAIINASDEDYAKLTRATHDYNGAAKDMAKTMQDNLQGQITTLKSKMEGLAIQIGEKVIPHVTKFVDKLMSIADALDELSPATQDIIIKAGLFAAALGPVLVIGGRVIFYGGRVIELLSVIGPALGTLIGIGSGVIPVLAGIAVVGVGLAHDLKQDVIPAVDLFGDECSEATKKAVGGFLDLNENATQALNELNWSGKAVTKDIADNIVDTFNQMGEQIKNGLEKESEEAQNTLQELFANTKQISAEEQAEILENAKKGYEERKATIDEGEARIKEIMEKASNEKRGLTEVERIEINRIQGEMKQEGIKTLSESEEESRAIMERMRRNSEEISARQAADVVKNSVKQRDETIKNAEEQYDDTVKAIIRQRDDLGTISEEQAKKLIDEAERQKDETIATAKHQHENIVSEAKKQSGEHVKEVDWETGEVKSKWQVMCDDTKKWFSDTGEKIKSTAHDMATKTVEKFNNIKDGAKESFDAAKEAMLQPIEDAKAKIKEKVDAIKSFFTNLELKIPKPSIPDIPKPSVDWQTETKFGIDVKLPKIRWHAKAMNSPMLLNSPTIFGMQNGKYLGAGEAGQEVVSGANTLMNMIEQAVKNANGNAGNVNQTININQPIATPDELARTLRLERRYGMMVGEPI